MPSTGVGLILENVEQARAHELAEFLVERLRTVGTSAQFLETINQEAGAQLSGAGHRDPVKAVIRPRFDRYSHWHMAVECERRVTNGVDFHCVIAARLVISLQPPRNIGQPRLCVWLVQEIENLPAQCFASVNGRADELNVAEEILLTFVDHDQRRDQIGPDIFVAWRIDHALDVAFRNVKTLDQACPFLDVGGNKGQHLLRFRDPCPSGTDGILKQLVGRDPAVADEVDLPEVDQRAFVDVEPKAIPRLKVVADVHLRVAMFL
mgnify:CR=1 FL=1